MPQMKLDNFLIGLGLGNRESFHILTVSSLGETIFRRAPEGLIRMFVPQIQEMQEGV